MIKLDQNQRAVMQQILEQADIERLLKIVLKLDEQTKAEVLKAIGTSLNVAKKNFHLANIRRIIKGSDQEIKDWLVTSIAESYTDGANVMYADLKKLSVRPVVGDPLLSIWTADKIRQIDLFSVQKDAVNALISDAYLDFANGMNGLIKGAEHQLNEAIKRQTRANMISGQVTGASMRAIAKEVKETIGSQGFSVLIDKGGHQWTLERYSEMLARTHIMKSANEGIIARANAFNIDTMQVSTHPGACHICKPFEGKIYSISGTSEKYPKLTQEPPFHPYCRHRLLPRPELDEFVDN